MNIGLLRRAGQVVLNRHINFIFIPIRFMGRKRASEAREGALDETASPIKKSRATATTPPASPKKDSTPAKDVKSLNAVDSVAYSELPAQASVSATGRLAKIMTWNVAGLRGTLKKCPDILKTLSKKYDLDFLCIQETKISAEQISAEIGDDVLPGYRAYWSSSVTKKGYSGTAVFVNNATFGTAVAGEADITTASKQSKSKKMTDFFGGGAPSKKVDKGAEEAPVAQLKGRVLRTELDLHGTKHSGEGRTIMLELDSFYLVACYVPNSGQNLERLDYRVDEWEPDMRAYLKNLSAAKPVIYCGDLNVAHLDLDIYNFDAKHIVKQSGCTPRERAAFGQMLSEGFVDAFRHLYPDACGHYTYWSQRTFARNVNKGLRLDYFVCSADLASGSSLPRIRDCFDIPSDTVGVSDHAPALLIVEL